MSTLLGRFEAFFEKASLHRLDPKKGIFPGSAIWPCW